MFRLSPDPPLAEASEELDFVSTVDPTGHQPLLMKLSKFKMVPPAKALEHHFVVFYC